jgi:hypothetical protein
MTQGETDLEMVQRHVSQGLVHLARQYEIVAELRAKGRPTQSAQDLLVTFQELQGMHENHLERLLAKG